jgi:IMP dehydrogenase family protein
MQDQVSIGMGRTARRVFGLDQVDIVPSRRTRSSHDVDTTWKIDAYRFDIPVMSHPSDAVVTPEFAIEFGKLGGLPVINAEGLWGRQADLEGALEKVRTAAGGDDPLGVPEPDFAAQAVLQELHSVPVDAGLLTERIAQVRDSGVTFGVRVSPQHARELAPALIRSGLDLLVIQGTLISAQHVYSDGEPLDLRDFVGSLDAPVIAGGVVDYSTAKHLMRTGVAGVIVGAGTTTNTSTLGIDVPMATAISDAAAAPPGLPRRDRWTLRPRHRRFRAAVLRRHRQVHRLWRGRGVPRCAAGPGGELRRTRLLLAVGRRPPAAAPWRGRRGHRTLRFPVHGRPAAGEAALRSDRQPLRPGEPRRWPEAVHGQVRLHRPEELPEGSAGRALVG